ncbi:MAG: hypothetical protein A2X86_07335 [Bdellovibrionales bacterium GWA2_49_15]|nr:MAG: hypothetical protein A2X86_07335 [Bdellovibrionales bacterium GWA2_49_15]HAZ11910.1 hypothetical protein [Bdellovibrionales bacterium]
MNRVFLYPEEIASLRHDREIVLHDDLRPKHVREVLKAQVGDDIRIVAINSGLGEAKILHLDESSLRLCVSPIDQDKKQYLVDEIWVGACRPQTVKKIFEYATAMRVGRIRFFKAELSEKSYLTSKIFEPENQRHHLALGLAQSGIYFQLPQVTVSPYFPTQAPDSPAILCSTTGRQTLFTTKLEAAEVTLVFGPERGLTIEEEARFLKMGMTPVKVYPSILRIEVAVISALSQLHARRFFLA